MNDLCQPCCPFCGSTSLKQTHCQDKSSDRGAQLLITECAGCGALCTVDLDVELSQIRELEVGKEN